MKMSELSEWGRIVKDINTTVDVGPNEIKTQAAKFGNIVDKDGFPPTMSTSVKSTRIVKEIEEPRYTAREWAIIEGGHTLDEQVVEPKKPGKLFTALTEGIMLKLERDKRANMLVLHVKDTETGRRSEVRGKLGYETNGYDANDPLHQLLDKIGKTANISELMNGELVSISPKHPQGADAIATAKKITSEDEAPTRAKEGEFISPPGNTVGLNVFEISPQDREKLNGKIVYHQTKKLPQILKSGGLRPRADASGEREFAMYDIRAGKDWRTPKGIFVSPKSGGWFGDEISFKIMPTDKIYRVYSETGHLLITNPVSADRFISAGPINQKDETATRETPAPRKESRVLQSKISPLRALVLEYLTFTSTGIMTIVSDGAKSPEAAEELKKVYWTLSQSGKNLQSVVDNEQKLEANKTAILKNIHDMMSYAISHLKANMIPQEFDSKKKQINSVLVKYNDLTKSESVEENFADGKKPGRKGLAKRSGVNTKASVSSLRKTAKSSSGEKQRMAHWLANMKAGKKK